MPVARGPRMTARNAIVVGLAGVISGVMLMAFVVWATGQSSDTGQFRLGDSQFRDITADRMARRIADEGPVLFPDVSSNGTRDVYVQHLGSDPKTGWLAFDARRPSASRDCFLEWQRDRAIFVDRCDGTEVPADGAGLRQYPAVVNDGGKVVIDFNAGAGATTSVPSSSTR
jgi:hypothetical protein